MHCVVGLAVPSGLMVLEGDGDTVLENARSSLTLSVRAEYIYSTDSNASCPGGVLILREV
jgi:hypothetical protein